METRPILPVELWEVVCPTCLAWYGDACITRHSGKKTRPHAYRIRRQLEWESKDTTCLHSVERDNEFFRCTRSKLHTGPHSYA